MIKFLIGLLFGAAATFTFIYIENRKSEKRVETRKAEKKQLLLSEEQTLSLDILRTLFVVEILHGKDKIPENKKNQIIEEANSNIRDLISRFKTKDNTFAAVESSTEKMMNEWAVAFKSEGSAKDKMRNEILSYCLINKIELMGLIKERYKQLDLESVQKK